MKKVSFPARLDELEKGMLYIEAVLTEYKIKRKIILDTLLVCEEAMVRLIQYAKEDTTFEITIKRWHTTAAITLSAEGQEFKNEELQIDLTPEFTHDSEESIRSVLLHAYADKIVYYRNGPHNFVRVNAGSREPILIAQTFMAFVVAYLLSILIRRWLPGSFAGIVAYVLVPFQTGFLNALQMITAPTIFFSIMTATAQYTSLRNSGRTTLRLILWYILTSVIAVLTAICLFRLVSPHLGLSGMLSSFVTPADRYIVGQSIYDMLTNIIPSNIVSPFLNTDAMQLLLMALLSGVALGRAGHYAPMLKEIADALNRFFQECLNIITKIIPTAVFLLTLLMILYYDEAALYICLAISILTIIAILVMNLWYPLLLLVVGRINPVPFLRKSVPHMWNTFINESGNNLVSDTVRMCRRKLGISPSICSFSIPFGSMANMDGNCVYLTIAGMLIAYLCGVNLLGTQIISILFMVIVLSIGSAITPASVILALTMLMSQLGISPMVISLLVGINIVIEIFISMCNTISNIAITLLVARSENMVNLATYNQK